MPARHHYVPQCYLKNFCINGKPGYLYAYQRNASPILTTTKSIGAKKGFYLFENKITGERSEEIEQVFGHLEGLVSPILEKLIGSVKMVLSNEERSIVSEFIANLHIRNLSYRAKQENLAIEMAKHMMKLVAQNRDVFQRRMEKAGYTFESPREVEELRQTVLEFDEHYGVEVKGGHEYFLRSAIDLWIDLAPIVFYKEWHFLDSTESRIFATSDNPVILVPPRDLPPFYGSGFANSSIIFPISPSRCLLLKNKKGGPRTIFANRLMVDFVNSRTMYFAHKFIFANLKSRDIERMFSRTTAGESERMIVN